METRKRTIVEVVAQIQEKKAQFNIHPAFATFAQIKAEIGMIPDCELYRHLNMAVDAGYLLHRRVMAGDAYEVA